MDKKELEKEFDKFISYTHNLKRYKDSDLYQLDNMVESYLQTLKKLEA